MHYRTETHSIPNVNGLSLDTELYIPDMSGTFPVVYLLHGFTGYKEGVELTDIARRLSEEGIVSVRFTASGFGGSGGTIAEDYRFTNHRSDIESVYAFVSGLPYVDRFRTGIYGHSMGGKLAVLFAGDHPDIRALCVVSAPVSFTGTLYGNLKQSWEEQGYFEKVSGRDGKTVRIPFGYYLDEESPQHDVLQAAHSVRVPDALVIAGKKDTEVPWTETKRIYESLPGRKQWVLIDGLPHTYRDNPQLMDTVHTRIVRFFKESI